MKPQQLIWREELANLIPTGGVCAELGVQWGYFSAIIDWIAKPKELVLVDCWKHQSGPYEIDGANVADDEHERRYQFVVEKFKPSPHVRILRQMTHEAVIGFPDSYFDFVYLDACHLLADVRRDLHQWWPKVKTGGLFCGHDYWQVNAPHIQVAPAVDEFCREQGRELDYITLGHCGSWGLWKR